MKRTSGEQIVVPLEKFSSEDQVYLGEFPSLKEQKKPSKLPWVDVSAIVKSRSKDTSYNIYGTRFDSREIKMLVNIDNHSNQSLELNIIWMFFADGVSSRMQLKSIKDYYPFDVETTKITLKSKHELSFETSEARKTAIGYGQRYKNGSKIKGFVVQAYWDGWLLNGYASHPSLNEVAADENLMKEMSEKASK